MEQKLIAFMLPKPTFKQNVKDETVGCHNKIKQFKKCIKIWRPIRNHATFSTIPRFL